MRAVALLGLLLLSGCSRESAAAERRYELLQKANGRQSELCAAAISVRDAYLKEENLERYRWWDLQQGLACQKYQLEGDYPGAVADNMAVGAENPN